MACIGHDAQRSYESLAFVEVLVREFPRDPRYSTWLPMPFRICRSLVLKT